MPILHNLPKTIARIFSGRNLLLHLLSIILTFIIVTSGFDWLYYKSTRVDLIQTIMWPAVILGFLIPIILFFALLVYGKVKKNLRTINTAWAVAQAGILGLTISTFYKIFTGRPGPHHITIADDISKVFHFGFLRGGSFQGWPSSHTAVAFAISMAIFILYPEKKWLRYTAVIYALYIGIGVSVNIHWFSDFVAGAIIGSIIGIAVGKSFLEKIK